MKALLIILGLTLSLGAFAEDAKGYGEDQEGCGSADELKGCKCIKQSIAPEDATTGTGSSDQDSSGSKTNDK